MVVRAILAAAMLLAFPAAAQDSLPAIRTDGITGATIQQHDIRDPDDVMPLAEGGVMQKTDARIIRPARSCQLDAGAAQRLAVALKRVQPDPNDWTGLKADMVIRFAGARGNYGELVAVIEPVSRDGAAEARVFYAGKSAYLLSTDRPVVAQILADAGCPLYVWPEKK